VTVSVAAIDVGSTAVRSATRSRGRMNFASEPHLYLDLPDDEGSRRLVERFEISPVVVEGRMLICGDEAVELGGAIGRVPSECFERGLPASSNRLARAATRALMERTLRPSAPPGEACVFCVPEAAAVGPDGVPMSGLTIGSIIAGLGYEPAPFGAAVAAGLGAAGPDGTGLVIVIGQSFTQMTLMVLGDCIASVTTRRAGYVIDREAAEVLGLEPGRVRLIRERGVDLSEPQTREEEAIAVYVRTSIAHLVLSMREHAALLEHAAAAAGGALPVWLAGGFARTGGLGGMAGPVAAELAPLAAIVDLAEPEAVEEPELAVLKGCILMAAAQPAR